MILMAEHLRIGIIGAGANTRQRHIPGFRALENVEIAGVVNRTAESSRRVAQEFGIPKVYSDWQELIDDDALDAVLVGTWPYLHAPATIAAQGWLSSGVVSSGVLDSSTILPAAGAFGD